MDFDCDLLIIGGGINGAGIARDAAGRGLKVMLVEQDDLAGHTSSASTKLIHGGLRYLEYGEIRLVRESLIERERLLALAPHIIWPLTFVLPHRHAVRPAWMVRLGLFLYDHLGGRKRLPGSRTVKLQGTAYGEGLDPGIAKAFTYADCWVEDSRLVALNALDAAERGAAILTRTRFTGATRDAEGWTATIEDGAGPRTVRAHAIVNAAGPWVAEVLKGLPVSGAERPVRLVKGSHIVVPRLHHGDHALMLQNPDKRIVFVIPYEGRFSLVGTTEQVWTGMPGRAAISDEETRYLCDSVNRYFARPITPADVVWSYAGIRPLHEDHAKNASAVTRDYVLGLDAGDDRAPLLNIFGGKITTFRKLAEHALDRLTDAIPMDGPWTATAPLPGGDIADFEAFAEGVARDHPFLPADLARRLARAYGTRVKDVLGTARDLDALGQDFGGGLYEAEAAYLVAKEWARTVEDILWRRSKLGLHVPKETAAKLHAWLETRAG